MAEHQALFTWGAGPSSVSIAGGFNDWSATATPLIKQPDGSFKATISMPWGSVQAYKYIVDGDWMVREDEQKDYDAAGNHNNIYVAPADPTAAGTTGTGAAAGTAAGAVNGAASANAGTADTGTSAAADTSGTAVGETPAAATQELAKTDAAATAEKSGASTGLLAGAGALAGAGVAGAAALGLSKSGDKDDRGVDEKSIPNVQSLAAAPAGAAGDVKDAATSATSAATAGVGEAKDTATAAVGDAKSFASTPAADKSNTGLLAGTGALAGVGAASAAALGLSSKDADKGEADKGDGGLPSLQSFAAKPLDTATASTAGLSDTVDSGIASAQSFAAKPVDAAGGVARDVSGAIGSRELPTTGLPSVSTLTGAKDDGVSTTDSVGDAKDAASTDRSKGLLAGVGAVAGAGTLAGAGAAAAGMFGLGSSGEDKAASVATPVADLGASGVQTSNLAAIGEPGAAGGPSQVRTDAATEPIPGATTGAATGTTADTTTSDTTAGPSGTSAPSTTTALETTAAPAATTAPDATGVAAQRDASTFATSEPEKTAENAIGLSGNTGLLAGGAALAGAGAAGAAALAFGGKDKDKDAAAAESPAIPEAKASQLLAASAPGIVTDETPSAASTDTEDAGGKTKTDAQRARDKAKKARQKAKKRAIASGVADDEETTTASNSGYVTPAQIPEDDATPRPSGTFGPGATAGAAAVGLGAAGLGAAGVGAALRNERTESTAAQAGSFLEPETANTMASNATANAGTFARNAPADETSFDSSVDDRGVASVTSAADLEKEYKVAETYPEQQARELAGAGLQDETVDNKGRLQSGAAAAGAGLAGAGLGAAGLAGVHGLSKDDGKRDVPPDTAGAPASTATAGDVTSGPTAVPATTSLARETDSTTKEGEAKEGEAKTGGISNKALALGASLAGFVGIVVFGLERFFRTAEGEQLPLDEARARGINVDSFPVHNVSEKDVPPEGAVADLREIVDGLKTEGSPATATGQSFATTGVDATAGAKDVAPGVTDTAADQSNTGLLAGAGALAGAAVAGGAAYGLSHRDDEQAPKDSTLSRDFAAAGTQPDATQSSGYAAIDKSGTLATDAGVKNQDGTLPIPGANTVQDGTLPIPSPGTVQDGTLPIPAPGTVQDGTLPIPAPGATQGMRTNVLVSDEFKPTVPEPAISSSGLGDNKGLLAGASALAGVGAAAAAAYGLSGRKEASELPKDASADAQRLSDAVPTSGDQPAGQYGVGQTQSHARDTETAGEKEAATGDKSNTGVLAGAVDKEAAPSTAPAVGSTNTLPVTKDTDFVEPGLDQKAVSPEFDSFAAAPAAGAPDAAVPAFVPAAAGAGAGALAAAGAAGYAANKAYGTDASLEAAKDDKPADITSDLKPEATESYSSGAPTTNTSYTGVPTQSFAAEPTNRSAEPVSKFDEAQDKLGEAQDKGRGLSGGAITGLAAGAAGAAAIGAGAYAATRRGDEKEVLQDTASTAPDATAPSDTGVGAKPSGQSFVSSTTAESTRPEQTGTGPTGEPLSAPSGSFTQPTDNFGRMEDESTPSRSLGAGAALTGAGAGAGAALGASAYAVTRDKDDVTQPGASPDTVLGSTAWEAPPGVGPQARVPSEVRDTFNAEPRDAIGTGHAYGTGVGMPAPTELPPTDKSAAVGEDTGALGGVLASKNSESVSGVESKLAGVSDKVQANVDNVSTTVQDQTGQYLDKVDQFTAAPQSEAGQHSGLGVGALAGAGAGAAALGAGAYAVLRHGKNDEQVPAKLDTQQLSSQPVGTTGALGDASADAAAVRNIPSPSTPGLAGVGAHGTNTRPEAVFLQPVAPEFETTDAKLAEGEMRSPSGIAVFMTEGRVNGAQNRSTSESVDSYNTALSGDTPDDTKVHTAGPSAPSTGVAAGAGAAGLGAAGLAAAGAGAYAYSRNQEPEGQAQFIQPGQQAQQEDQPKQQEQQPKQQEQQQRQQPTDQAHGQGTRGSAFIEAPPSVPSPVQTDAMAAAPPAAGVVPGTEPVIAPPGSSAPSTQALLAEKPSPIDAAGGLTAAELREGVQLGPEPTEGSGWGKAAGYSAAGAAVVGTAAAAAGLYHATRDEEQNGRRSSNREAFVSGVPSVAKSGNFLQGVPGAGQQAATQGQNLAGVQPGQIVPGQAGQLPNEPVAAQLDKAPSLHPDTQEGQPGAVAAGAAAAGVGTAGAAAAVHATDSAPARDEPKTPTKERRRSSLFGNMFKKKDRERLQSMEAEAMPADAANTQAAARAQLEGSGSIGKAGAGVLAGVTAAGAAGLAATKSTGTDGLESAKTAGTGAFDQAKTAGTGAFDQAKSAGTGAFDQAKTAGTGAFDQAKSAGTGAVDSGRNMATGAVDSGRTAVTGAFDSVRKAGTGAPDSAHTAGTGVRDSVTGAVDSGRAAATGALDSGSAAATGALDSGRTAATAALDAGKTATGDATSFAHKTVGEAFGTSTPTADRPTTPSHAAGASTSPTTPAKTSQMAEHATPDTRISETGRTAHSVGSHKKKGFFAKLKAVLRGKKHEH
ncbi:hypothetical protein CspeluHIS016_0903010 [Cutaneotrichosporon spelunceum]|uniref:AMP-activated protein kinase glycogen-binding domain-containing protein n=1 Tax=Cutaneotrichosporon spelunceum TaxID=1672016 RepID=A0AAD3YFG9_9TREE|nr:hypothetical protein CspeluHIS016_0903010 [Cutaneotrichosporon spelunceum]